MTRREAKISQTQTRKEDWVPGDRTKVQPSTRANTLVSVKVRRMEQVIEREKQKVQLTLKSFMDLRSGLVGS